jgi:CRP-like cAMP-binding protein
MISTELLRRYHFFAGFTDRQLRTLARCADEVAVESGKVLFRPEDELNNFYVLTKGQVSLFLCTPSRLQDSPPVGDQLLGDVPMDRIVIETVNAGNVFAWSALVPPYESSSGAMAPTDSAMIEFDARELITVFEEDPAFGYLVFQKLASVIHERLHNRRIEDLWSLT